MLYIFIGAGAGGVLRFLLAALIDKHWQAALWSLPVGTMLVNILGSACIGYASKWDSNAIVKYGVMIGLLGGFTTFSSFSLQTMHLLTKGSYGLATAQVLVSVLLCLAGTALGLWLAGKL